MCCASVALVAQSGGGLDPAQLLKPLADSWPSYSGDYTGRRYSALTQVNQSNVKNLTLAWVAKVTGGPGGGGGRGGGGVGGPAGPPTIVGGEGSGDVTVGGAMSLKGSILEVDGVLYVSAPDNAWALDAHDGHELWHYFWKTKGGTHIGNRGLGDVGQLLVHGDAGRLSGVARRADRQGALAQGNRQLRAAVFLDDGAGRRRESRAGRHRQRSRCAGIPHILRSGNRRAAVEVLHRADESGRPRARDVEEPRRGAARRRSPVAARRVRSGDASLHLRHRQSDAGLHVADARRRRQSLHVRDRRGQRRHRQDGVVLTRRRRTTRTTGIRRRRRCWWTATSAAAGRARWC